MEKDVVVSRDTNDILSNIVEMIRRESQEDRQAMFNIMESLNDESFDRKKLTPAEDRLMLRAFSYLNLLSGYVGSPDNVGFIENGHSVPLDDDSIDLVSSSMLAQALVPTDEGQAMEMLFDPKMFEHAPTTMVDSETREAFGPTLN